MLGTLFGALGLSAKAAAFVKWGFILASAALVFFGLAYGVKNWLAEKDALLQRQAEDLVAQKLAVSSLENAVAEMKYQSDLTRQELDALRASDARIGQELQLARDSLKKLNLRKARDDAPTPKDVDALLRSINGGLNGLLRLPSADAGPTAAPNSLPGFTAP